MIEPAKKKFAAALGILLALSLTVADANRPIRTQSLGARPTGCNAGTGLGLIGQPWAKLPGDRAMGSPGGVHIDNDGEHLWAIVRCGNDGTPRGSQTYCDQSDLDPHP